MAITKLHTYPLLDIDRAKNITVNKSSTGYAVNLMFKDGEYTDRYFVEFPDMEAVNAYLTTSQEATKRRNYLVAESMRKRNPAPVKEKPTLKVVYNAC